ncbi:unnamed protein product [Paramecium pentaurelia]|uniref:Uncharacterized protein n=1 Tax=Paramecium pentaurelia TaxID=43138 RepID=A0A8S1WAD7_9CILI|nr:unnamed protein product [Paramecium pentaurelia]
MSKYATYDIMCKFLILGSSQVGKTNLLMRFIDDNYSESHITTIGVDFKFKEVKTNGKIMKMQIWDTAGQEKFRTLTSNYYKFAHGVLLVYAVDDLKSFQDITYWMNSLKQQGRNEIAIILIANKKDIVDQRIISQEQGEELAYQLGVDYIETSAKLGLNVYEAFQRLAELAIKQQDGKVSLPILTEDNSYTINLTKNKHNLTNKKGCC